MNVSHSQQLVAWLVHDGNVSCQECLGTWICGLSRQTHGEGNLSLAQQPFDLSPAVMVCWTLPQIWGTCCVAWLAACNRGQELSRAYASRTATSHGGFIQQCKIARYEWSLF